MVELIDDGNVHYLPPGLGCFPLQHVDDFPSRVPAAWSAHGGVMLPMYQSEALWIYFHAGWVDGHDTQYPFAVKVAAGQIDAVTGQAWTNELGQRPQNYMSIPEQPWLDGFCVEKGIIRQFVAMPMGAGYTAEEQVTGTAQYGGLQILVHPMKRDEFERRFPKGSERQRLAVMDGAVFTLSASADMGLAPGGRMKQEVYRDRFGLDAWDRTARSRCFVHRVNSLVWEAITDQKPPTPPPTSKSYTDHGLPWFDYYAEGAQSLDGAEELRRLKSVLETGGQKGGAPLPENEPAAPDRVVRIRGTQSKHEVREGAF